MKNKDNYKNFMKVNDRLFRLIYEQMQDPKISLKTIAEDFDDNEIDYCIIGGISLSIYNYSRYTGDIDVLISKEGFEKLNKNLIGRGYVFRAGSKKNVYFTNGTTRIPMDFLIEGDKEGDFILPSPNEVKTKINGVWYLNFNNLLKFKLKSFREQDKVDIIKLIENNPDKIKDISPIIKKEINKKLKLGV